MADAKSKKIKIHPLRERLVTPAKALKPRKRYPFRAAGLDFATMGGAPVGHITVVFGLPGSGKTTITMLAMAEFLRREKRKKAVFVQADYKFDTPWFSVLGGDPSRVNLEEGDALEVVFDLVNDIIKDEKDVGFIAMDSVRAMTTSAEYARDFTQGPGQQSPEATVTNRWFRKLNELLAARRVQKNPVTLFVINHETLLPPVRQGLAPTKTLPYGKQQTYANHLRIEALKPVYHEKHKVMGADIESVVEIRFRIPRQVEGPRVHEGSFKLWQVPGKRPKGFVDDINQWWEMGKSSGYIVGHDGLEPRWTFGDGLPALAHSDILKEECWALDREQYLKDQDVILPAVLPIFFDNVEADGDKTPDKPKRTRKKYKKEEE